MRVKKIRSRRASSPNCRNTCGARSTFIAATLHPCVHGINLIPGRNDEGHVVETGPKTRVRKSLPSTHRETVGRRSNRQGNNRCRNMAGSRLSASVRRNTSAPRVRPARRVQSDRSARAHLQTLESWRPLPAGYPRRPATVSMNESELTTVVGDEGSLSGTPIDASHGWRLLGPDEAEYVDHFVGFHEPALCAGITGRPRHEVEGQRDLRLSQPN